MAGALTFPARRPTLTLAILLAATLLAVDAARDLRPEVDFTSTVPPSAQLDAYREMLANIDGVRFSVVYMEQQPGSAYGSLRSDAGFDALVDEQARLTEHINKSLPPGALSHTLSVYEAMRVGNYMFAKIATAGNPPASAYSVPSDPVTYRAVRDEVREGGAADDVLAADGSSAIVLVFFETRDPIAARSLAATVEDAVEVWSARTSAHPATTGHQVSGLLNAAHYVDDVNARETRTWTLAAGAVVLVALTLALRGPVNAAIAVASLGAALAWTYGIMAAAGIRISFLTLFLAPVVIGVGVDYAVHVLQRHEEERRRMPRREALARALASTGPAVLVAGLTTLAGLAALLLIPAPLYAQIGGVAAVGVGLGVLASLTLAPALRALLPQRAPRAAPRRDLVGNALERLSRPLARHPVLVALGVVALLAGAGAYGLQHARVAPSSVDDELPADDPVALLQQRIEEDYGAFERAYLVVRGDLTDPAVLRALYDATRNATRIDGVRSASSVTDLLLADASTDEGVIDLARAGILGAAGQGGDAQLPATRQEARERLDGLFADPLWRSLAPFTISADYRVGVVALTVEPWNGTRDLAALADRLDAAARGLDAALPAEADAQAAGSPMNRASIVASVPGNLGVTVAGSAAAVLVVLLVAWVPRHRGRGAAAALAGAVVALGACVLLLASVPLLDVVYQELHAQGLAPENRARLSDVLLLAFALTVASGVDDVVVLAHRHWEARAAGSSPDEARAVAFRGAGRAITATTLVNALAFAALSGTYFLQSKNLAILAALGILYAYLLSLLVAPLFMRR